MHIAEVQQDVLVTLIFDQAVELLAHFLNLLFGHDLGINETDNRHSINIFQTEETARALRHRETPVGDGNRTGPNQYMFVQAGPARGPLSAVPESTEEPTEARTLRNNHTYQNARGIKGPPRKAVRANQTPRIVKSSMATQNLLRAACSSA